MRLKEEAKKLKADKRAQTKLEKQLKSSQIEEKKKIEDKSEGNKTESINVDMGNMAAESMEERREERKEWQKGTERRPIQKGRVEMTLWKPNQNLNHYLPFLNLLLLIPV